MNGLLGFGRGIGRGLPSGLQTAEPVRPGGSQPPGVGPLGGAAPSFADRQVESDPAKGEYEAWRHLDPSRNQAAAPYIPGLHRKPDEDNWDDDAQAHPYIPGMDANPNFNNNNDNDLDGEVRPRLPDAKLVNDFRSGKKNPISALTEYCTAMRLTTSFKEVAPLKRGAGIALQFANECSINGKAIRAASGRTKKEAKTNAAKATFTFLLGLSEDDLEDDDMEGKQMVDSFGRKVTLCCPDSQWGGNRVVENPRPLREDQLLPRLNLEDENVERDLRARENEAHPVDLLTKWSVQHGKSFIFNINKQGDGLFRASVRIESHSGEGVAATSKLAKREAASAILAQIDPLTHAPGVGLVPEKIEDTLASVFHRKHQEVIFSVCSAAQRHLDIDVDMLTEVPAVGFILHRGHQSIAHVVSLGIGMSVAGVLPRPDGRVLIDLHAFSLARRGLIKYLQSEIRAFLNGEVNASIFQRREDGVLELKPQHRFSMFSTHAATGDMDVYAREDRVNDLNENYVGVGGKEGESYHVPAKELHEHGQLRFKTEEGLTHAWDTLNPSKNEYPMSCSDKILRCNVLGVQGALLSQLIRPIYIHRVVFGSKFDHGVCVRALCCRVDDDKFSRPEDHNDGFLVQHPRVGRVTEYVVDSSDRLPNFKLAANWSLDADPQADSRRMAVEILDPECGEAFPWSPFKTIKDDTRGAPSRLCKAANFYRFKELLRGPYKSAMAGSTYLGAKQRSESYNAIKSRLKNYLVEHHWGRWVDKPRQKLEAFTS